MSAACPGNYLVLPPREWYRYDNRCASSTTNPYAEFNSTKTNYVPFVNLIVNPQDYIYQQAVLQKGNILQYKKNSSNLTKNQRYSQIAKGMWVNRTTTFASQSETVTIPNTNYLKRIDYSSFNVTNGQSRSNEAVSCPSRPPNPLNSTLPETHTGTNIDQPVLPEPIVDQPAMSPLIPVITAPPVPPPDEIIQDGGILIGTISENSCTGQIYKITRNIECYPTTDSDVPGPPILLCWNDGYPTTYPRTRLTYTDAGGKWPQGSKFIKAAFTIPSAPNNFDVNPINGTGSFDLSWEPPTYSSGIVIVDYLVTVTSADATYMNSYTIVGLKATITGLENQVNYTFTVAGITSLGIGQPAIQRSLCYQIPNAVTNFYGYGENTSVVLYWDAPTDCVVTSYTITYVDTSGNTVTYAGIVSSEATDIYFSIYDLTNGYTYTFTIYAVNTGVVGPGTSTDVTPTV